MRVSTAGWIVALAAFAAKLPLADAPLERDEGANALIALEAVRGGRLPYRDFVTHMPPLLFLLTAPLAAASAAAGGDPFVLRAGAALVAAAAAVVVASLGAALAGARAGLLAGLAFSLAAADPSVQGWTVHAESLMLPFTALAALRWWQATGAGGAAGAARAGAWLGAAALVKPPAAAESLLLLLPWFVRRRRALALALAFLGGAGGAGATALVILWLVGVGPALVAFLAEGFRYVGSPGLGPGLYGTAVARAAPTQAPLWFAAAVGLAAGRVRPDAVRFLLLWLAGSGLGVLMGRRAYPHYFQQLVPPLAVAAGLGLDRLLAPPARARWLLPARVILLAGLAAAAAVTGPLLRLSRTARAAVLYPRNAFHDAEIVARRLAAATPAGSRVFIAGSEPEIAFLAGRRLAGRHPTIYHLSQDTPAMAHERVAWLAELGEGDVRGAVFCGDRIAWDDAYGSAAVILDLRARVRAMLAGPGWRRVAVLPRFSVYRRVSEPGRAPVPSGTGPRSTFPRDARGTRGGTS